MEIKTIETFKTQKDNYCCVISYKLEYNSHILYEKYCYGGTKSQAIYNCKSKFLLLGA